jgi:zinc protease
VLGEYNKSASSPFLKLNEVTQNTAFTKHPYRHTTIGFLDDIKDMPNQFAYSKVFFNRWYRPENCTVIVAGDVKHDDLVALARQYYGPWKRGLATVEIPEEPAQGEPRSARVSWPVPTLPILLLSYHIPATLPSNPDTAALAALAQVVFGETSPLYQRLVLSEQRAVQLSAEASPNRDPGLFQILARVRKSEELPYVRQCIKEALDEAATTPIEPARLSATKSHLRYDFAGSLDSADAIAGALGEAVAISGRTESINELFEAHDRLGPSDLQRVAAHYFQANNETAVILETEIKK